MIDAVVWGLILTAIGVALGAIGLFVVKNSQNVKITQTQKNSGGKSSQNIKIN